MNQPLLSSNILIVEDNAILACDLENVVCDSGGQSVGPAYTLEAGLKLAESEQISAALLDINLGDDLVWPLARNLRDNGIPFSFLSAACGRKDLPDDLREAVCMDKPATQQDIIRTLQFLLDN